MSRYCSLPECDSKHFAKGLCKKHYRAEWRERKLGRPSTARKNWSEKELMALTDLLKARVIPAPRPLTRREMTKEMERRFGEPYEEKALTCKLHQMEKRRKNVKQEA